MWSDGAPLFRRSAVARAALVVAALVGAAAIAFPVAARLTAIDEHGVRAVTPPAAASPTASPVPLQQVGRDALSRVVTVETDRPSEEALGTAWLFDDRGDFVTNAHVVSAGLTVRLTDRAAHTLTATVVGTDAAADIAVVRAEAGFAGPPLAMHTGPLPLLPVPVVDLASSRATGHDDLTVATLARTGEDVPLQPGEVPAGQTAPSSYHDMLAITGAKVYQGNSGGPVLDGAGRVVGILTLASPNQPEAYAIPLSRVLDELRRLATGGG